MKYTFQIMNQNNAEIIALWKYPGEYAFYDFTADKNDYDELIDSEQRQNNYYQVLLNNELVGFLYFISNNYIVDIGFGLHPNLTGKSLGYEFVNDCINFIKTKHPKINTITLSVATFNKRAIKLYKKIGFIKIQSFNQSTNGSIYPFIKMELKL